MADGRARLAATKKGRLQKAPLVSIVSRDKGGGAGGSRRREDHAEPHCIPRRTSALRVGPPRSVRPPPPRVPTLAVGAEQREQSNATRGQCEAKQGKSRGSEGQKHGAGSAEPRPWPAARGMPAAPALRARRALFQCENPAVVLGLGIDSWRICATCCSSASCLTLFAKARTRLRVLVLWLSAKPANPTRSLNPVEAAKRSLLLFCTL